MSDFLATRPGAVNSTGDARALFLKKYAGEVLTTFQQTNVMMGLHMVRTIQSGKTAQFPVTGVATASYHVPGTELGGQNVHSAERTINIDSLLVSDVFIANIDEAMSQYDARAIYSTECGRALALQADQRLLRVAVLTARASSVISGGPVGNTVNTGDGATNATSLLAGIFSAAEVMDGSDVPSMDRVVVLKPAQYYLIVKDSTAINRDWSPSNGSYAEGRVLKVADISVVKSNHVPTTNVAVVTGEENTYNGNFNSTIGVAFQKQAFGTVKLMDLSTEMEYSVRHQGTLIVAKYAMGHGILRPECAVELIDP